MEGGQEVTYAYTTSDNNTVTVIGDPSVPGQEFQLEPSSAAQTQQIFHVSNNSGSTETSQKSSTPFTPVRRDTKKMNNDTIILKLFSLLYLTFTKFFSHFFRPFLTMKM